MSLSYGGQPLLDEVELQIERGERICLLGANGAGKSTMLRVLSGETSPDSGKVVRSTGISVTRLTQQVPTDLEGTVLNVVCPEAIHDGNHEEELEALQILGRLKLDPAAAFETLSGGTRRRALLAKTLLGSPDVVLLDEPTNHLDIDSIAWLEEFLLRYCRTFLFVTHDRAFLRRLATRVIELDRGNLRNWNCNYDSFLVRKEEFLDAEAKQWAQQDKKLAQEEAWLRKGVRARRTRNEGRVRALHELRAERSSRRELAGSVQMSIESAGRTGQVVLKAKNVSFGYDNRPIIKDFSTVLTRGDKVGILGPNGCGKTTLLRLLLEPAGSEHGLTPQSGTVVHGTNLQVVYSDQLRSRLDENKSLADNVAEDQEFVMIQGVRRHIFGYLQDFLFEADRVRQPVRTLSGGERNRLLLARLFAQPSNVLVLDEPTNDLDLDTLDLLEDQLVAYPGTVLLVSHDRSFLDEVVTSVFAFEKHPYGDFDQWLGPDDGWYANEYVGGYEDWAKKRVVQPDARKERKAAVPESRPPARKKLTFAQKKELSLLPSRIESLEKEQADLHTKLSDPAFFRQDSKIIAAASQRVEEVARQLESLYTQWQELEAIKD